MTKQLFLARHAKTEFRSESGSDYERRLKPIGRDDARAAGEWLAKRCDTTPVVVSSTALRAAETAKIIAGQLGVSSEDIRWKEAIYEAMPGDLLPIINRNDQDEILIMIGHNPGFEMLAHTLSGSGDERIDMGLPTGGIAAITKPPEKPWEPGVGKMVDFYEGHRRHRD